MNEIYNLLKGNKITNEIYYKFLFFIKRKKLFREIYTTFMNRKLPLHINKIEMDNEIKTNPPKGVIKHKRKNKIIISITTYPKRIDTVYFSLYSLLNQSLPADEVVLWLTEEEFPQKEDMISKKILSFKDSGLQIKWCNNFRSYNKLLPTLKEYPKDTIVTADDDIYYPGNWLEKLYNTHRKFPKDIICHRAHRVQFNNKGDIEKYINWDKEVNGGNASYLNFLTGVGGVLYPSGCFNKEVGNIRVLQDICPCADDVWFWAMAVFNNTKIRIVNNNIQSLTYIDPEEERKGIATLTMKNVLEGKNDEQIRKVLNRYPSVLHKLNLVKNSIE